MKEEREEILSLKMDASGHLWVGTGGGLARIGPEGIKVTLFEAETGGARVSVIEMSPESDAWVGLLDGRLLRVSRDSGRAEERWRFSTPVTALTFDRQSALWVGTDGDGLYRARLDQSGAPPVPSEKAGIAEHDLPSRIISALHSDSQGHLWVATPQGLSRLDRENRRFAIYRHDPTEPRSLSGNLISALSEDAGGVLWIATDGAGISRLDLNRFGFAHIRVGERESGARRFSREAVWGFAERPDGSVWIGLESGLGLWHPAKGWQSAVPELAKGGTLEPGGTPFIQAVLEDHKRRVWLGTRGDGLYRVDPGGSVTHLKRTEDGVGGLPHNSITVLHEDVDGRFWVGTLGGGVARWMDTDEGGGFLSAIGDSAAGGVGDEAAVSPRCRHVTAIACDGAGRTWVASWEGLFLLDRELGRLTYYRDLSPRPEPLSSESAISLLGDSGGYLWVGTVNSGVNRLDPVSGEVKQFTRASHGLPDDRITGILEDGDGFVWVSTGKGAGRLQPETGKARRFCEADGLLRGGFHTGAAIRLRSGAMLMGGADGFSVIHPDRLPPS
ncbi:MAG: two-component regulator propeller domain-containing protein, partial [Verrucomicrobiales bacterium]